MGRDDSGSKRESGKTMAVATPETFLSSVRRFRPKEEDYKTWRLPHDHIVDLRDVARGVEESNVGVCCSYLIDHLTNSGQNDIDSEDGYVNHLSAVERFCDQFEVWNVAVDSWRKRIMRCRRAIQRMYQNGDHKHAGVLHVVYGHIDPLIKAFPKKFIDVLGELAPLARYTDAVEVKRQEMARLEAVEASARADRTRAAKPDDAYRRACVRLQHLEEMLKQLPEGVRDRQLEKKIHCEHKLIAWHRKVLDNVEEKSWIQVALESSATADEIEANAVRHGFRPEYGANLVDLLAHRDYYERALRIYTSADALMSVLAPVADREYGESEENFRERRDAAETKRDILTSQIRIEADKLLTNASKVYHRAWLASA